MPYAILRFAKKKAGGVSACYTHNERLKAAYKSNPDIDPAKSNLNYHLAAPQCNYRRAVSQMIAAAGCKTRRDSTVMVETVITASPEFMRPLPAAEQREYFQRAYDFMKERIGEGTVIAATVHMDEKTPHMHLSFCPITPDKRLSAKDILGNQARLSQWQTDYHAVMSARWPVLERGLSSMETGRKHIPVWLFKARAHGQQFGEVELALADITALNARRKREEAMRLLAAWLPQAERFTAQLKTVQGHINQLEHSVDLDAQNLRYLRSNSRELENKNIDQAIEIRRLREQLQRQKRLLDKIPPELLQQLKHQRERGMAR